MTRVALLCPGRGSYTEKSLGSLARLVAEASPSEREGLRAADALRAEHGLEPLAALDGATRFEAARHLRPANAAALIWAVSMLGGARVLGEHEACAIAGNSLGWYTALALGGALSFADGFRLVQEMALLQEGGEPGGQLIYAQVDAEWRRSQELEAAVARLFASAAGELFPSIALGGYAVLAGTKAGVQRALKELPPVKLGATSYPFQLAFHGPYHTPLASGVAARARDTLGGLEFFPPAVTLVDGRGARATPWSADIAALRDYTLGRQVDTPYDFTASVRTVLREQAPERLVLLGPGNTLGGVVGQILVELGWRGIASKSDFERAQAGERAPVESRDR